MNVVDIRRNSGPKDDGNLLYRCECYQKVWREWGQHLDTNEQMIVLQFIDRTIGWGRREAYFIARAVLKGDAIYSGLPMGRTKFYKSLAALEERDIVRRRKDPHVPDRVHFSVNMEWKSDVVNLPKRLQNTEKPVREADYPVREADYPVRETDTIASNHKLVSQASSLAGAAAPLPLAEVEKVRERVEETKAANRGRLSAKARSPQAAVDAVDAAWRLALIDTFPGTAYRTWGVREKAQIKTVLRNWRGDCTFPEFVTWAVTNWTAIMSNQFKWMKKQSPPSVPTLSFFIYFLEQFADARAEGVLEDWLSAEDRTQIEKMMGRGLTWEEATADIAKTKAAVALRSEIEKGKIAARTRDYAATRKLAEAKALAELKGGIPIHPKSPAALRMIEEERRAARAASTRPNPTKVVNESGELLQGAEVYFVDPDRNPFDH